MRGMNAGVDERGVTPAAVAAGFVAQLGR
jgi:hypothetical protein